MSTRPGFYKSFVKIFFLEAFDKIGIKLSKVNLDLLYALAEE